MYDIAVGKLIEELEEYAELDGTEIAETDYEIITEEVVETITRKIISLEYKG